MYIPKQGDICYMDFAPTKGHEQTGLRPAIVISRDDYNQYTNMAVLCAISANDKEFPTHYKLTSTKKINGSVLCEHIRSVDFKVRKLTYIEKVGNDDFTEIIDIINGIIEL